MGAHSFLNISRIVGFIVFIFSLLNICILLSSIFGIRKNVFQVVRLVELECQLLLLLLRTRYASITTISQCYDIPYWRDQRENNCKPCLGANSVRIRFDYFPGQGTGWFVPLLAGEAR